MGVRNAKRLLEDIPNKIQANLGIVSDVRLHTENGLDYIEIHVDPSPYPVNYHGVFHYRSGSTKQELKGNALTRFIFDRTGLSWEGVAVDGVDPNDLWRESFSIFRRRALGSGRMTAEELSCPDEMLLDRLGLMTDGRINRAGVLLFSHFPETVSPFCCTRIGYFSSPAELVFQDEVRGSLLEQVERVDDLLYSKYLVSPVTYDGIARVERQKFPREAVRELVCNALIHSNWARGVPIQIKVLPDRIYVSNVAILPRDLTVEKLLGPHRSEPYNPLIAGAFYRAGYVESWGRGIDKIRAACEANGNPMVEFELDDSGVMAEVMQPDWWEEAQPQNASSGEQANGGANVGSDDGNVGNNVDNDGGVTAKDRVIRILTTHPKASAATLASELGLSKRQIERILRVLREEGRIARRGGTRGHWEVLG